MSETNQDTDRFSRQLDELQRRVLALQQRASDNEASELLAEALTELNVTVEELRVGEEEIRQSADQLQASQLLLDAERRRYLDLFEFAPDGYLVTDGLGVIREVNRAASRLFRRPQERLLGKPVAVYVAPKDTAQFRRALVAASESHGVSVWDTCLVGQDHNEVDLECTVAPVRDPATGQLLELRWRLHDISERKRNETELHASRETLRELSARMEAVREDERLIVARAVHDEIGAALTAIKMEVGQFRHGLARAGENPDALRQLHERTDAIYALIDSTMEAVRRIAKELRPAVLDDFGLVAALDWQLNEFQKRSLIMCSFSVAPGDSHLDKPAATAVFRVFQEILTNVARHAQATRVDVRLYQDDRMLVLDVRDNGRGIRDEDIEAAGSLGMLGMRERVRLRGGTLEVQGKPGEGTLVRVRVPLSGASPDGSV